MISGPPWSLYLAVGDGRPERHEPIAASGEQAIRIRVGYRPDVVRLHGSAFLSRPPHLIQNRLDLLGQRGVAVTGGELIRLFSQRQALPRAAHLPKYF